MRKRKRKTPPKRSSSTRTKPKQKPRFKRHRFTLPISFVLLMLVPIGGYLLITKTKSNPPNYLSGLDVLSDCDRELSATVLLNPQFDSETVEVMVAIKDAKEVIPRCKSLSFVLPSMTSNHHFMLPTLHGGQPIDPDRNRRIGNAERPLADVSHTDFGNDVVTIDMGKVPDFTGNVEFTWSAGLQKRSYSDWRLRVPFGAVKMPGENRKGIQRFQVSMPVSDQYRLKDKSIEPSARKALEDSSFYWFDIEKDNTVLDLTFENDELAKQKERIKDICLVTLGVGAAVFLTEFILFISQMKQDAD